MSLAADDDVVGVARRHAVELGGRDAVVFAHYDRDGRTGETTLTFDQLDLKARAIAASLSDIARPGDRAGILCRQGVDYVTAFLGCAYAGVVAVPLFAPESFRKPFRLVSALRDAGATTALTTAGSRTAVEDLFREGEGLTRAPGIIAVDEVPDGAAARWREHRPTPEDVAYLQYTSGSTSSPSGVVMRHRNVIANVRQIIEAYRLSRESRVVSWLPFFHDMGMVFMVLTPLLVGFPAAHLTPQAFVQRPLRWLEEITRHGGTLTGVPNVGLALTIEKVSAAEKRALDLSSLGVVINGSEPVRAGLVERFTSAFAEAGFRPEAFNPSYGLAEATVLVSSKPLDERPRVLHLDRDRLAGGVVHQVGAGDERSVPVVSCGVPAGQGIVVAGVDDRHPVEPGRVGEIWVSGPNVADGYWTRSDRDGSWDARLDTDDERAGHRWLRTGDLGFQHDGHLYVVGRIKDLVIIHGRNVHPTDVEVTAEGSHPVIRTGGVAAFGVDGDSGERLVVVVEVDPAAARREGEDPVLVAARIAMAVRRAVAAEHEVEVEEVVAVRKGTVPKTSSGKIQRSACRAEYLADGLRRIG
ncbi:fatty acyl-AMP ligase [Saccharothrix xinjiangensis]|uniref:Fatty acyl-AMP ligase n=1 Tax=Saccharothrix xinjiangensis TaxID=204798 RepID=A0ABV9Y5F2_9PSEU